ncbi:PIG-M-domain-containing protein [Tuber borchii]|uniref:GPI mannosyltransferase 1 n=1 Tax=Tuber borchii TaxID=42251 RepID=A0A2T7A4N3_TUBBO|nr:PIG-M-domain-containing protein [Tuber borchii]
MSLRTLLGASILLRITLLLYGLYQDYTSPLKYTDIDYYVFTDASRYLLTNSNNASTLTPYSRETYRYTPLLAWLLLPTALNPQFLFFSFGKIIFAAADVLAGWLIYVVLTNRGMDSQRAGWFAGIWLVNPMVATISTRGSSEGLLGVLVVGIVWAVLRRRVLLAGVLVGLATHFKIYPVIYAPTVVWWLESEGSGGSEGESGKGWFEKAIGFVNRERVIFGTWALGTFVGLNVWMYKLYASPFLQHTYLHHLSRVDHRHNFSPYNTLLHLTSSPMGHSSTPFGSIPFLPQLLLSGLVIPLAFAKHDLPVTMFAQTFAFVSFNKVCTSQYFMWYIVLLPFYLPGSVLLRRPWLGGVALVLWAVSQAVWLEQGYELEFLGKATFVPGLWVASLLFFAVNVWLLGIIVGDIRRRGDLA